MRVEYDTEAGALYVRLRESGIVARTEAIEEGTLVDVDESGEALGIEVIHPDREWPLDEIFERWDLEDDMKVGLRELQDSQHPKPGQMTTAIG